MNKLRRASEWPKTKVSWAFDGYLPRKTLAMVAGKRGDGKSLVAQWISAQVSAGNSVRPDGTLVRDQEPGTIWFNTMEDAPDTVARERLQAAGALIGSG